MAVVQEIFQGRRGLHAASPKQFIMKKNLLNATLIALSCFGCLNVHAQWCIPNTIIPYAPTMPGITHVVVGTIDRTSSDLEHYPSNSYVNTGLSTDLAIGGTYSVSISHTIDASICPDMNLRVWIDYNLDYSLDDAGETAISVNHHAPGTYTGTFTVPATAVPGSTVMRVTAKMSDLGGHTLPTPCDLPNPDPFGYHGEMEDYTVNIINTTGISNPGHLSLALSVFPTVVTDQLAISISSEKITSLRLCNTLGELVWSKELNTYDKIISIGQDVLGKIQPGVYFVEATGSQVKEIKKVIIQ